MERVIPFRVGHPVMDQGPLRTLVSDLAPLDQQETGQSVGRLQSIAENVLAVVLCVERVYTVMVHLVSLCVCVMRV